MIGKYWRKDSLVCHSEAGKESPTFTKFLTPRNNVYAEFAFGVSKSTIYRWIKKYESSNNNPASLKNRYVSKKRMKLEKLQKTTERDLSIILCLD